MTKATDSALTGTSPMSYNAVVGRTGIGQVHRKDLEIINMIYCRVLLSAELVSTMGLAGKEGCQINQRHRS